MATGDPQDQFKYLLLNGETVTRDSPYGYGLSPLRPDLTTLYFLRISLRMKEDRWADHLARLTANLQPIVQAALQTNEALAAIANQITAVSMRIPDDLWDDLWGTSHLFTLPTEPESELEKARKRSREDLKKKRKELRRR